MAHATDSGVKTSRRQPLRPVMCSRLELAVRVQGAQELLEASCPCCE